MRRRLTLWATVSCLALPCIVATTGPTTRTAEAAPAPTGWKTRVRVGSPNSVVVAMLTTDNYQGGSGWTAAYGCAAGYQGTSSVNNSSSPIASNVVIVPTDAQGDICIRAMRPTDIIVDVAGTLPGAQIHTPQRVLDTRPVTVDRSQMTYLEIANWWRSLAGMYPSGAPLTPFVWDEQAAQTAQNHVDYLASIWAKGSSYCFHYEDPVFPAPVGVDRTHSILFCGKSPKPAIDGWALTPFHGFGFFNPYGEGFGIGFRGPGLARFGWASAAGGRPKADRSESQDAVFPAPGGVMPALNWLGGETPDPTEQCPSVTDGNAPQIFAYFGSRPISGPTTRTYARWIRSWSLVDSDGQAVPACRLDERERATGPGGGFTMTIFPQVPFIAGERYTVTIDLELATAAYGENPADGFIFTPIGDPYTLSWSFTAIPHHFTYG